MVVRRQTVIITFTTTLNKVADSGSPCFTPDSTLKSSAFSLFILSLALVLIRVNLIGIPKNYYFQTAV